MNAAAATRTQITKTVYDIAYYASDTVLVQDNLKIENIHLLIPPLSHLLRQLAIARYSMVISLLSAKAFQRLAPRWNILIPTTSSPALLVCVFLILT
ncbi:hypothetical protein BW716_34905 [[Flexibacter] sp. ATCC 35208]|nr:hypothetical protein BW716_34905 [[Flexibacter] sp. ATCC 35208]